MRSTLTSYLVAALAASASVSAASHSLRSSKAKAAAQAQPGSSWTLKSSLQGQALLDYFNFETESSSSQGGVADYVSLEDAMTAKMAGIKNNVTYLGVDTVEKSGSTRKSTRMSSKTLYGAGTMLVVDVLHAPVGCGTWPAIWTTNKAGDWPGKGELDMYETVNEFTTNSLSAHTKPGFSMKTTGFSSKFMLNSADKSNCDVAATDNQGCGLRDPDETTAGAALNENGGGVYVMEWTDDQVAMYFFNRTSIPEDITAGKPNPGASWGTPRALFKSTDGQSTAEFFQEHTLVINTNLCGQWVEGVWGSDTSYAGQTTSCAKSTGYSSCAAYVTENGSKFKEAYWALNSIEVYN